MFDSHIDSMSWFPFLPRSSLRPIAYLATIGVVAVCALLGWGTRALGLTNANIVMLFLSGVVFVSVRFGHGPAITAAVLSVVVFDFFFVDPILSFAPSDTQYFVGLAVMLGTALLISELTARLKSQLVAVQNQEHHTAQLYQLTRRLGDLAGTERLVVDAASHVANAFDGEVAVYLCDQSQGLQLRFGEDTSIAKNPEAASAAEGVVDVKRPADLRTYNPNESAVLFVPMIGSQQILGVLAVRPHDPKRFDDADERRTLETCANLIALSIERDESRSEAQQAQVQVESERLRNALLSSVSHDLRTPLATIAVTASSLLDGDGDQSWAAKRDVLETVIDESHRLAHQVDNLLDMARLNAGKVDLDCDWQVLEELVGVSLRRMRHELKDRSVIARIPDDLPLVWAASELVEQVFVNLLENATHYTPLASPIEISAVRNGDRVEVRVADHGPGIPAGSESQIFDLFARGTRVVADGQRGVGLGLTICRSIVRAHGGEITAANRPEGGAEILITLPCAAQSPEVTLDDFYSPTDS